MHPGFTCLLFSLERRGSHYHSETSSPPIASSGSSRSRGDVGLQYGGHILLVFHPPCHYDTTFKNRNCTYAYEEELLC